MAQLAIEKGFMSDFSKLEKHVQAGALHAIDVFGEHTHAGLHLEKIQHARDDRMMTIRTDKFWRGVVIALESGDVYCMLKVLPHDKAISYAATHKVTVNTVLGVMDIHDAAAYDEMQPALVHAAEASG